MATISITPTTKAAAAYLTVASYIDSSDANTRDQRQHMKDALEAIPAHANGPYKLIWGPATNNGILLFAAQSTKDHSYAVAFRGSLTSDADAVGFFTNWADDMMALQLVAWKYPQGFGDIYAKISSGMNDALALAIAATDPNTSDTLIDFLRDAINKQPGPVMVTGHSLGGALANVAAAWLADQLRRGGGPKNIQVAPFSLAAPTVTDSTFADVFEKLCPIAYHCVNTLDVVPMAWADIEGVRQAFPPPGESMFRFNKTLWIAVEVAYLSISGKGYTPLPGIQDRFQGPTPTKGTRYNVEVGNQHSMQDTYWPHLCTDPVPIAE